MSTALAQDTHSNREQPLSLPYQMGEYLLYDQIGQGGMADIYLATCPTGLGGARRVVVKRIRPHLADDPYFSDLLAKEAKLAANLNHANVVQVLGLGRVEGALYIAMEYVEGLDLHQLLRGLSRLRVPLPAENALTIVLEVLRGLDYAHRFGGHGVIHRDVSPSNILISMDGEVRVCDFGIARALEGGQAGGDLDPSKVSRMRLAGKSAYMAPEQANGESIDARADVFAAGILLWEVCAGRRMYRGTDEEMLRQARAGDAPLLPERGMPDEDRLRAIVSKALSKRPEDRYSSAAEMLEALEEYVFEQGWMASPLRFGRFLEEHFGYAIVKARRLRERRATKVLAALRAGPLVSVSELTPRPVEVVVPQSDQAGESVPALPMDEGPSEIAWGQYALWGGVFFALGAAIRWFIG